MILHKASDAESADRDRATFEAWGGPLSLACYQAAVARLRRHGWASANAQVWLLRGEDAEVLSSCETYRVESRLGANEGTAYAIGNVYTEPRLRGHGHAAALLKALARDLPGEDPSAQALILFSDVSLKIYEKAGFEARPALSQVFEALPGPPQEGVDALLVDAEATQALGSLVWPQAGFLVLPGPGHLDWHLEREWIFSEIMARPRPVANGARAGAGSVFWCADFAKDQLDILLLQASVPREAEALLACARRVAHAAGLDQVVLWSNPGDALTTAGLRVDREVTLDSVPMLLGLNGQVQAADWTWIPKAIWV